MEWTDEASRGREQTCRPYERWLAATGDVLAAPPTNGDYTGSRRKQETPTLRNRYLYRVPIPVP